MTDDPALSVLLDELRCHAALPLEHARSMPPQAYRSEAFRELERERIFAREWHCVGRLDELSDRGDYVTFRIDAEPILVIRDESGALQAYSNVCRHRMAPLLTEARGNIRHRIVCPYHAWSYGLDGALKSATHMGDGFETRGICLPRFKVEVWEGWVYVSLSAEAPPLAPRLSGLSARLKNYRVAEFRTLFHVDEVWDTNWKVLYENFSESYHVFALHGATIDGAQPTRLTDCSFDSDAGFYYYEQGRQPSDTVVYPGNLLISNPDLTDHQRRHNPMMCVYPSHAFAVAAERMFWMSLQPQGVGQVRVRWGIDLFPGSVPPDWDFEALRADMRRISEAVNAEDRWMIETMYRNAGSAHVRAGPISPLERTTWELQRYLAAMIDVTPAVDGRAA